MTLQCFILRALFEKNECGFITSLNDQVCFMNPISTIVQIHFGECFLKWGKGVYVSTNLSILWKVEKMCFISSGKHFLIWFINHWCVFALRSSVHTWCMLSILSLSYDYEMHYRLCWSVLWVRNDIILYGCGLIYRTMLDRIPGNSHDTGESESQIREGRIPRSRWVVRKM